MFFPINRILLKAALVITSCFFLLSCENDIEDIKELNTKRTSIEEGKNIEGYLSQEAKMKAKLTAPLMRRFLTDSPYIEFPNSLHVDFFNDSMKVESQLNARYGRYKTNENRVFLRDSVVVFNTLGDTLHCMELWWDQQQQKYYTDKPVRIHRPNGQILHGNYGMTANQNLTNIEIRSGHGRLQVPENEIPD
jgi:LPS export ABC transporter protein LptC